MNGGIFGFPGPDAAAPPNEGRFELAWRYDWPVYGQGDMGQAPAWVYPPFPDTLEYDVEVRFGRIRSNTNNNQSLRMNLGRNQTNCIWTAVGSYHRLGSYGLTAGEGVFQQDMNVAHYAPGGYINLSYGHVSGVWRFNREPYFNPSHYIQVTMDTWFHSGSSQFWRETTKMSAAPDVRELPKNLMFGCSGDRLCDGWIEVWSKRRTDR